MRLLRSRRTTFAGATILAALVVASPASAHFIVVTPPGNGNGTSHHVGQFPPGHNSCYGLSTADSNERSDAVNFLGPPAAACPP